MSIWSQLYNIHNRLSILELLCWEVKDLGIEYFLKSTTKMRREVSLSQIDKKNDIILFHNSLSSNYFPIRHNRKQKLISKSLLIYNGAFEVSDKITGSTWIKLLVLNIDKMRTEPLIISMQSKTWNIILKMIPTLIHSSILRTLMIIKALYKNILILHSAGIARKKNSVILVGPGGIYKTTIVLNALKQGWKYQSDDLSLIMDGKSFVFPYFPATFNYLYEIRARSEYLSKLDYMRILIRLLKNRKSLLKFLPPTEKSAKISAVIFVEKSNQIVQKPFLKPLKRSLAMKVLKNNFILSLWESMTRLIPNPMRQYLYSYSYACPRMDLLKNVTRAFNAIIFQLLESYDPILMKAVIPLKLNYEYIDNLLGELEKLV